MVRIIRYIPILYSIFYFATCDQVENENLSNKNRMLGIDAMHKDKIKIDKDTIITRNMKLDSKTRTKNPPHRKPDDDQPPDWSYKPIPKDLTSHVDLFKRNMTECLKEVQTNDKRAFKRLSPKQESPVHGECLIACVLKRNGVIEKGKINKGNLISLVSKFYAKDTKLMKKLEKNLDRCIELSLRKGDDECTLASRLNDCTNDLMASNKHKIVVNY